MKKYTKEEKERIRTWYDNEYPEEEDEITDEEIREV